MTALGWCVLPYLLPDAAKMVLAFVLTGQVRQAEKQGLVPESGIITVLGELLR